MKAVLMIFLFFAPAALSQTPGLSLSSAVSKAESNNPELKRLKAAAEKASWGKLEALSGYLPHLSAGYDHFISSDYMIETVVFQGAPIPFPAGYPQDNLTLDASWTVFDGLTSWHRYKAASLGAEAADLDVSRARFQIEEEVRAAFFRTLAAQKLVEVAQQNIKTLEDHLDKAHITLRAGYGTKFDVLRIEAKLEEARAELVQTEANYHDSRSALNEVMGLESDVSPPLIGQLPVLTENDVPKDLALAPSERQDLSAQKMREDAADQMRSAANGFWFPSISLFGEEQYYKFGDFSSQIEQTAGFQNASMFGVRLKWNLFDGGYSYAKQREAAEAAAESASVTHKLLTKLPHEFETWKRNYFQSISLYRARSRALQQYEESVRLAVIGVKAGTRTHTEMLDAELDLFRARAGLVKAQAEAIEALGKLELALGRKIWKARE